MTGNVVDRFEHIAHPEHWCRVCNTRIVGSNMETHVCPFYPHEGDREDES